MAVVRKVTLPKSCGMLATLPATIITAMASPTARPMPSTTPAAMPLLAAGMLTLKMVSVGVAPRARLASSYSGGTARSAVSDTLMMEGRIMTESTSMAASRLVPLGRPKTLAMRGTSTDTPIRP